MNKLTRYGLTSLILLFVSFNNVKAVEYGGIGGRPAFPRADNQRTESIFVHTLNLGQVQPEGIKVINNTSEKKTVMVYAVDSVVSSGGAFSCAQLGDSQSDVGTWIKLTKNEVTLDPISNETIPFDITVPNNADVGEHNGCIILQEKKAPSAAGAGIMLSFRTGLRVAIMIPGDIKKTLQVNALNVTRGAGKVLIHPSVKNSGNVSIDATVKVLVQSVFGQKVGEFGGGYPILRDQTSDWNYELTNPYWGGWYKTSMTVSYDEDVNTEIGKSSGKIKTLVGPQIWLFVVPAPLAMIVEFAGLALILTLIVWLIVHWRRSAWIQANWLLTAVEEGDDIVSLAKKYQVSWKLIAKANNLAAPYALKVGQKIKLPPQ